ncbi:hypothetical protein HDR66_02445 [bacterium]|nr:hypothetical protein [bacterium]
MKNKTSIVKPKLFTWVWLDANNNPTDNPIKIRYGCRPLIKDVIYRGILSSLMYMGEHSKTIVSSTTVCGTVLGIFTEYKIFGAIIIIIGAIAPFGNDLYCKVFRHLHHTEMFRTGHHRPKANK